MSSEESNNPTSDENGHNKDGQEKKVCFICGSHTLLIVNIHERRCGPNMIDVISEKFKMRPLNDDKFLCYSCNNWLINWYSMQPKNVRTDAKADDDIAVASGSSGRTRDQAAGIKKDRQNYWPLNVPSNVCESCVPAYESNTTTDTNDSLNTLNEEEDSNIIELSDNENGAANNVTDERNTLRAKDEIVFTAAVQAVREKLQKYLYYPNKRKRTIEMTGERRLVQAVSKRSRIERSLSSIPDTNNVRIVQRNCSLCNSVVRFRQRQVPAPEHNHPHQQKRKQQTKRFRSAQNQITTKRRPSTAAQICRKCELTMPSNCSKKPVTLSHASQPHEVCPIHSEPNAIASSQNTGGGVNQSPRLPENTSHIVNKLKMLGTSIYREHSPSQCDQNGFNARLPMLTDETDITNKEVNDAPALRPLSEKVFNDLNEIVLTFNTVVTEVVPMEMLNCNLNEDADTSNSSSDYLESANASMSSDKMKNFHEIIKNVPKSLSITLA